MFSPVSIPPEPFQVIQQLEAAGYEAWAVGGCVRDSLLGAAPQDWDIATNALPRQTMETLSGFRLLETGLAHGTVTAVQNGIPVEITTYRIDGAYAGHRRPRQVTFTPSLKEDLARRDFTINAMAYHPRRGLRDFFGGREDLQNQCVRCVGDPSLRFEEDGLRLLRALRFASRLGFRVEASTARAVRQQAPLLRHISAERIQKEWTGLLAGRQAEPILREFAGVVWEVFPELRPMEGFLQYSPYHIYDVWEHTLHTIGEIKPDPLLRLVMLFHDSGKPACFTMDANGVGHFKGHPQESVRIARQALGRLKFDRRTTERVLLLVEHHDLLFVPDPVWIKKHLHRLGQEAFFQLLEVEEADNLAKAPGCNDRLPRIRQCRETALRILEEGQCFSLAGLAVGGDDLQALGIPPGPRLGGILARLLDGVMEGTLTNDPHTLRQAARQQWQALQSSVEPKAQ